MFVVFNKILRILPFTLLFILASCGGKNHFVAINGATMGTTYLIKIVAPPEKINSENIKKKAETILLQVNQDMSTYINDSLISQFNKLNKDKKISVSVDFIKVLKESNRINELTDGSFDISVLSTVEKLGFGAHKEQSVLNSSKEVKILNNFGQDQVVIDNNFIYKLKDNIKIDFSSIAKGFAVDKLAELLDSLGFDSYIVEIGGEIKTKGLNPDSKLWSVAIEKPDPTKRSVLEIIKLNNKAIATSGSYRNFYINKGKKLTHIIDPATGKSVDSNIVSATVIGESCMTVDALATAMMIMPPAKSIKIANNNNLAVMIVEEINGAYKIHYSSSFSEYKK